MKNLRRKNFIHENNRESVHGYFKERKITWSIYEVSELLAYNDR